MLLNIKIDEMIRISSQKIWYCSFIENRIQGFVKNITFIDAAGGN